MALPARSIAAVLLQGGGIQRRRPAHELRRRGARQVPPGCCLLAEGEVGRGPQHGAGGGCRWRLVTYEQPAQHGRQSSRLLRILEGQPLQISPLQIVGWLSTLGHSRVAIRADERVQLR